MSSMEPGETPYDPAQGPNEEAPKPESEQEFAPKRSKEELADLFAQLEDPGDIDADEEQLDRQSTDTHNESTQEQKFAPAHTSERLARLMAALRKPGVVRAHKEQYEQGLPETTKPYAGSPVVELVPLRKPLPEKRISLEEKGDNYTRFAENLMHYAPASFFEKAKELFKGQIVIDLGAGVESHGYNLAKAAEARSYIAIEPNFPERLSAVLKPVEKQAVKIPFAISDLDMLSFLESLEDNSVSMIISGIDDIILPDEEYRRKVREQIRRVLSPQGNLMLNHSEVLDPRIEDKQGITETPVAFGGRPQNFLSYYTKQR